MQPTSKIKALSVLSMAVAATLGASASHGAILSPYLDNITVLAPDSSVVQSYNYASVGGNYSAIPTTINVPVGDTFEFGIDAVVTNNVNPDAGKATGTPGHIAVQPSYLGLSTLSIVVPSTDTNASRLIPNTSGASNNTFAGVPDYNSTASLNNQSGLGSSVGPNNNPGGFAPIWSAHLEGDVAPTSNTGGDLGDHFPLFQGNFPPSSNTTLGASTYGQYGAATATFGNATDFFDSLSYTATQPGRVLLAPSVHAAGSSYWTNTLPGSSTVASGYLSQMFNQPGDMIGALPNLVVNVVSEARNQPIISLTGSLFQMPTTYGPSLGKLTISGHNGSYSIAQLTGLNATTGYVEIKGFNPGSDEEIYALDVMVNGVQANAAQINTLVDSINFGDTEALPSSPEVAAATYAGLGVTHDANPFGSQYNLFLDDASGPSSDNFLGIDLANSNDFNLNGYTVSAIAVVPEPMSLSLLTLGGLGLLNRRSRRQNIGGPKKA
jgi:hypothetical protein